MSQNIDSYLVENRVFKPSKDFSKKARIKIKKGDCVLIYMPMIPEAAVAMLACARIGAVHSVVFGGFSSASIRDRLADSKATAIITADGGYRRGAIVPLKQNVDEALKE